MYTGGGNFAIQAPVKIGTFNLQGGNVTIYDAATFSSAFSVPSNSFVISQAMAVVLMAQGISGAGSIIAEGTSLTLGSTELTGSFAASSGVVVFAAESHLVTLIVDGAVVSSSVQQVVDNLMLVSGSLHGPSNFTAAKAVIAASGFNVNTSLVFQGNVSAVDSIVTCASPYGMITFEKGSTFTVSGTTQIIGIIYGDNVVVNHGAILVSGTLAFDEIDLSGSGYVEVAGTLAVTSNRVNQTHVTLSENGVFKGTTAEIAWISNIFGTPSVVVVEGGITFSCGEACSDVYVRNEKNFHFELGAH